jgi:hypothetical protein
MKKGLLSIPKEHEVDVSTLTEEDVLGLLGPEMTGILHSNGALDRAAKQKVVQRGTSTRKPLGKTGLLGVSSSTSTISGDQTTTSDSSSSSSDIQEDSCWQRRRSARLKAWEKATDTIRDRAIIESEENNDTFTIDARYAHYFSFAFLSVAFFMYIMCILYFNANSPAAFTFHYPSYFGSVARFLNHSCAPNLDIVTVMVESHDVRIPRYMEECLQLQ